MKHLSTIILAAFTFFAIYSCGSADATKPSSTKDSGLSKEDSEGLWYLGFVSSNNMIEDKKTKMWRERGLEFVTGVEMDSLIEARGFIISESTKFIGEIPTHCAKKITENYRTAVSEQLYYFQHGKWWPLDSFSGNRGVYVAAPSSYFLEGAPSTKTDPMVIVRTDGGWIVLAQWE